MNFPEVRLTTGSDEPFTGSSVQVSYEPDSVFDKSFPLYDVRIIVKALEYPVLSREMHIEELRPYKNFTLDISAKDCEIVIDNVNIAETIEVTGKIQEKGSCEPFRNVSLVLMLIDRQGCKVRTYERKLMSNELGYFSAQIDKKHLQWDLQSLRFSFFLRAIFEIALEYRQEGKHYSIKKTATMRLPLEDNGPTHEELLFNLEQLRAQIDELQDIQAENEWEWSMVPVIRKQREKPSSILTQCEVCGKHVGVGRKRFKQCLHCGRWVGVKCDSCWEQATVGPRTYCRICDDLLTRSIEEIRKKEPSQ